MYIYTGQQKIQKSYRHMQNKYSNINKNYLIHTSYSLRMTLT